MFTYQQEIARKTIHILNMIIPLTLYLFDRTFTLTLLIPITLIFISSDYLRLRNERIKIIYDYFFSYVTRDEEEKKMTGASYVFLSSSIIIFLFSEGIAICSLLIMSISDTLAALIGKRYGVIKFKDKTLEGSLIFFISSIFIILMMNLNLLIAIISVFIATYVEYAKPGNIDDNLSVPFSFSISYFLFSKVLSAFSLININ